MMQSKAEREVSFRLMVWKTGVRRLRGRLSIAGVNPVRMPRLRRPTQPLLSSYEAIAKKKHPSLGG